MTTEEIQALIAELRERAEHPATGSNVAQCMREAAAALAGIVECSRCGEIPVLGKTEDLPVCMDCAYEIGVENTRAALTTPQEGDAAIYGACGERGCTDCRPLFDSQNREVPGTEPVTQEGDVRERLIEALQAPTFVDGERRLVGWEPIADSVLAAFPVLSRAAAPAETEWEYARQNRYGHVCEPDDSLEQAEYRASLGGGYDTVVRRPLVTWEPLPVPGGEGENE